VYNTWNSRQTWLDHMAR